ncbi:hypothetical protein PVAP13_4NG243811 [Panicum virgatum]|uniref:Uncharacterized protein n=1 Tax=Panicum virgatum TaxID=38727 RepID=A0A8T0TDW7_PANVG|nr:hypothetical protein PVAP13_4NG243811 [Panicum virgatum]
MDPGGIGIGTPPPPPPPPIPPSSRASLPSLSRLLPLPEAAAPPLPPSMDRLPGPPRAPPPPRAARSAPLGRCTLPRRRRHEIRLAGPPRARPPPPPLGSASLGCAAGMSGAAGRRREAVPRAGGVGGGARPARDSVGEMTATDCRRAFSARTYRWPCSPSPSARPKARYFGPAQARPSPVTYRLGLARPGGAGRAWAAPQAWAGTGTARSQLSAR